MPLGPGSRPGVWTRYPLELAGTETTAGAIEAVTFGTNFCNILAGQFLYNFKKLLLRHVAQHSSNLHPSVQTTHHLPEKHVWTLTSVFLAAAR